VCRVGECGGGVYGTGYCLDSVYLISFFFFFFNYLFPCAILESEAESESN